MLNVLASPEYAGVPLSIGCCRIRLTDDTGEDKFCAISISAQDGSFDY